MEEVEECIQNFYVKLEETRHDVLEKQQSWRNGGQNPQDEEVCQLQDACGLLYVHVQKLWESVPMTPSNCDGRANGNDNNVVIQRESIEKDDIWSIMIENCTLKAFQLVHDVFQFVTTGQFNSTNNDNREKLKTSGEGRTIDYGLSGQIAIARLLELTIKLSLESKSENFCKNSINDSDDLSDNNDITMTIAEKYTEYQRQVLRLRSKPSIAHVAKIRKAAGSSKISVAQLIIMYQKDQAPENIEEDQHAVTNTEENEDSVEHKRFLTQPHAHAICQILGEASSLIHPLAQWHSGMIESSNTHSFLERNMENILLKVCHETIKILDQEAQTLVITVGNWFLADYTQSSGPEFPPCHGVFTLDSSVDEMAFICQVISRYCSFQSNIHIPSPLPLSEKNSIARQEQVKQQNISSTLNNNELAKHLQEQSLNYSTTEKNLVHTNLKRALDLAKPVEIVIGSNHFVPSLIEDAYFICTRAMERAHETLCDKAFWIVVHFITELWGAIDDETNTNNSSSGACNIYNALLKQIGCVVESSSGSLPTGDMKDEGTSANKVKIRNRSSAASFANALMNVLDQDTNANGGIGAQKAPLSGSSLQKINFRQVQIDSLFCMLNGIHAASSVCLGLSELSTTLQSSSDSDYTVCKKTEDGGQQPNTSNNSSNQNMTSMMLYVKEQLLSHSLSYTKLLKEQINNTVSKQCGIVSNTIEPPTFIASLPSSPSLHRLYYYFSHQQYYLDALSFQHIEADDQDKEILVPLRECPFIAQVHSSKCEKGVTAYIAQNISAKVVSLILGTILDQKKKFSDWGSLLLAKQIRMLENFFCEVLLGKKDDNLDKMHSNFGFTTNGDETCIDGGSVNIAGAVGGNTGEILHQFQRLSQAITVLQLEKPSDWAAFEVKVGEENNLTKDEIKKLMSLRVDFSEEAIAGACGER